MSRQYTPIQGIFNRRPTREAMPKMKTKSGAKKRFKLTGTGEIKRKHAFKNHILTKKEKKRKRSLRKFGTVHPTEKKNILALLN